MLDPDVDRPVVRQRSVICAYCGSVMEAGTRARRFCRPSCRALYSAQRRARDETTLLNLIEQAAPMAAKLRRTPRRRRVEKRTD